MITRLILMALVILGLLRPVPARAQVRPPAVTRHCVHALYVVPSNRVVQANAISEIQRGIMFSHDWYRDQMQRDGFGPKTFTYETEADGVTPRVHILNAPGTDAYYNLDPWANVSKVAASAGYPIWGDGQVWVIVFEGQIMNADGSLRGNFFDSGSFGSGSDGGVSMDVARMLPSSKSRTCSTGDPTTG